MQLQHRPALLALLPASPGIFQREQVPHMVVIRAYFPFVSSPSLSPQHILASLPLSLQLSIAAHIVALPLAPVIEEQHVEGDVDQHDGQKGNADADESGAYT